MPNEEGRFQPGDVVQLKSGGPRMTVDTVEGEDVYCVWFDENKQTQWSFKAPALEKVQRD